MKMKIIDISWPITPEMTTYKDRKDIFIKKIKTIEHDGTRESTICMNLHTGTHIDAPAHFMPNGKNVNQLPLESLMGQCQVIDCTHVKEKITVDDLAPIELTKKIALLKTKNSNLLSTAPFDPHFIYLGASGAQYLAEKGVKAIGIDYLGIERNQAAHETHKLLFEHEIIIIEGLRLKEIASGDYQFICLPLAIKQTEAVPARAILIGRQSDYSSRFEG